MCATLLELFARPTVIPVVTVGDADTAVAVAAALRRGGLDCIELTLRTPQAWDAAAAVRDAHPEMRLGIGTVTRVEELERAAAIGARFAVSPGLSGRLAAAGQELPIAYLPGIATAGELMSVIELGYSAVKIFPAEALGGADLVRQFSAVFPGTRFCPSGGVRASTLADYLAIPAVFAAAGTWLTPASSVTSGDWPDVESRARRALEICQRSAANE